MRALEDAREWLTIETSADGGHTVSLRAAA
jgi:hypothetical protein